MATHRDTPHSFPAVRSLLSPEALGAEVECTYAVGHVERVVLLRSLTNDVYQVTAAGEKYVLKVYGHGWRSFGEIAWEVDLLDHLSASGLPVDPAVLRADGEAIGTIAAPEGRRHTVLVPFAGGKKPDGPSPDLYQEFGRVMALLYQVSNSFVPRYTRRPLDLAHYLEPALVLIPPRLVHRPEDLEFVLQLVARARERITVLAPELDWGICHGDVSLDNIHVLDDGRIILYDLDLGGPGWRSSDPYGVMMWLVRGTPQHFKAFLAGYRQVRPLTEANLEAMAWFVPIRLLDNMRYHLSDYLTLRGSHALGEGYLDDELTMLRRWDRDVLNDRAWSE